MSFPDIACFYNFSVYGGILTYIGVVERNSGIFFNFFQFCNNA